MLLSFIPLRCVLRLSFPLFCIRSLPFPWPLCVSIQLLLNYLSCGLKRRRLVCEQYAFIALFLHYVPLFLMLFSHISKFRCFQVIVKIIELSLWIYVRKYVEFAVSYISSKCMNFGTFVCISTLKYRLFHTLHALLSSANVQTSSYISTLFLRFPSETKRHKIGFEQLQSVSTYLTMQIPICGQRSGKNITHIRIRNFDVYIIGVLHKIYIINTHWSIIYISNTNWIAH